MAESTAPPEVSTLTSAEELAELAAEWDALVYAMPRPTPYLLTGWLLAWLRHHGSGLELALHVARRDGRLVGVLPLAIERRFGVRVARFVGGDHVELADVAAVDDEVAAALARRAASGDHDLGVFVGVPAASRLERALSPERLVLLERAEAPVLDLSDGWQQVYERKVGSKHRYEHRRKRKKLAEQGELEVRLARTWAELEPALEAGFELYARRWEGRPERHGFATPVGRALHRDAFQTLAEQDAVRIVSLWLDGRMAAFHSYFVVGRTLCSDRLAYDGELARWSPGFLNTLDMLDAASAEGLTRVEFLGGTEEYKLALADALEPVYEAVGLVRTVRGRAAATTRIAVARSRRRLKRSARLRTLYYDRLSPLRRLLARATDR